MYCIYGYRQPAWAGAIVDERWVEDANQKYSRLRHKLQKLSSLFKAELVYEGRLKVIAASK